MKDLTIKPLHIGVLALIAGGIYFLTRKSKPKQMPLVEDKAETTSGGGGGGIYIPAIQKAPTVVYTTTPVYVSRADKERLNPSKIVAPRQSAKKVQAQAQAGNIIMQNPNVSSQLQMPSSTTQTPPTSTVVTQPSTTVSIQPNAVQSALTNVGLV